jgi:hypothetical protein
LRFARLLFDSLVYEGTRSGLRIFWRQTTTTSTRKRTQDVNKDVETGQSISSQGRSESADSVTYEVDTMPNHLCFLYILKELYPEYIGDIDGIFSDEEDIAKIQDVWNHTRERWWKENRDKLRSGDVPQTSGDWPYPALVRSWSESRVPEIGTPGLKSHREAKSYKQIAGSDDWTQFLAASDQEFAEWRKAKGSITEQDAGWFRLTSTAERLRLLASQLIALNRHLESSTERSKKIGVELLD